MEMAAVQDVSRSLIFNDDWVGGISLVGLCGLRLRCRALSRVLLFLLKSICDGERRVKRCLVVSPEVDVGLGALNGLFHGLDDRFNGVEVTFPLYLLIFC